MGVNGGRLGWGGVGDWVYEEAGTASSAVKREAFGLTIPEVRNVANVEEVVALVIEFVARA